MNDTVDPIMLSALQHWSYCPRQCALIHVEQAFDENVFTMRGNAAHERVDDPGFETFEGVRAERALPDDGLLAQFAGIAVAPAPRGGRGLKPGTPPVNRTRIQ